MTTVDRRVRLLSWLLSRAAPSAPSDGQLIKAQQRRVKHNWAIDQLIGSLVNDVEVSDVRTSDSDVQVPLRIYRAPGLGGGGRPLVVYFHGGGWVTGGLEMGDWLCSNVASAVGAVVVSVDYRLAPRFRFPTAVEDSYLALCWAAAQAARLGADSDRIAVMGESAGANLAAAVALAARDRRGPSIAHQTLLYPALDLTLSSASLAANASAPILTSDGMRSMRDAYLGDSAVAGDPLASPLLAADHSCLPEALIQVAEHDPLRDDGARYAAALRWAGVEVRLTEYVGMPHGYLNFPKLCRASAQALSEICAEQGRALSR